MENTVSNSSKVPRAKFLGSVGLFCFSNICRFSIFKDPFATITHLSELYFRFGRSILLVQTNKNLCSSTSCWKQWKWVRLDLILMMRDTYISFNLIPLTKFTGSRRSTEFKDILPWNISQMITKNLSNDPNQHKNSHVLCDETGHPILYLLESQWKLRKQHDQNLQ